MSDLLLQRDEVRDFISSTNGAFFSVTFTKRTTGEVVTRRYTTKFAKHLKGGQATYDAAAKGLLIVAEPNKGIRSIPLDAVMTIHAKGNTYKVVEQVFECEACFEVYDSMDDLRNGEYAGETYAVCHICLSQG